jgi:acyl-CoA thioester hydrolase
MPAFTLRIRVRYSECDAQNVVFNARYADFADLASTEFLRAAFGGYQTLQKSGFENQIVKLLIEWKAPARFDDVIDLSVQVGRVGNSSFTLETHFIMVSTGETLAQCEAVYVFLDAETFTPIAIPDEFRKRLLDEHDLGLTDQSGLR